MKKLTRIFRNGRVTWQEVARDVELRKRIVFEYPPKTVSLSFDDYRLLHAAKICGGTGKYCKCASVLRHALETSGAWSDTLDFAICNKGYEDSEVARLYDGIRSLIARGLLEGRGDLSLPAGPRYTECRITPAGDELLQAQL